MVKKEKKKKLFKLDTLNQKSNIISSYRMPVFFNFSFRTDFVGFDQRNPVDLVGFDQRNPIVLVSVNFVS